MIELPTDFISQAANSPFCLGISDELSRSGKWLKNQRLTNDDLDALYLLESAVLDHSPSELTNESGGRHYNKILEEEAACLSGVLLVPRAAAISIAASGDTVEDAAARYGISPAMMRMRLNQSGALRIIARKRANEQISVW
ncbi:ImmA/IrrE family metallo-endopeptidase [Acidovorax sp. sic0104]|uniref:ImmA/IrrE family metallo-endopeptidase n=1 Tax=Acidovorax sp. sic0104 TaxID=2854784 RepID=UPI001C494468|nr:ImmA/IrrE family metallo-endopeptidase [Acidovorax sp. sic0104]MBV7542715.1 ImmA/IrrE family metallo-endopeptidase [Acidovorax sp. sic0104]